MKLFTHARVAAVRVAVAILILFAGISAWVSASSLPPGGHTGQALALRAMLHPGAHKAVDFLKPPHFTNGRFMYDPKAFRVGQFGHNPLAGGTNPSPILLSEPVQTFDVYAPPPSFTPNASLTSINLTPVWSPNETYLVYSSNVAGDGHFHLFAVPSQGGVPVQLTTGPGNEFFPSFNRNGAILAFTSDANSTAGNQDLYIIGGQSGVPLAPGKTTVDVSTLATNTKSALTLGDTTLFTSVSRPALNSNGDQIVFSATTASTSVGHTAGSRHIYYLNVATRGFDPNVTSQPAQLTDGQANDTDPAWSPKGDFVAFASTASSFANTGQRLSLTTSPTASSGTNPIRGIFLLNAGSATAVGTVAAGGARVTAAGTDDFGPAWSADIANQYTNPDDAQEYIAFARGAAANKPHDIYYMRLTQNNAAQNNPTAPITIFPEGNGNAAVKLNTDDSANSYDDIYPSWSPFISVFSLTYQSGSLPGGDAVGVVNPNGSVSAGRSVTYNTPTTNLPTETAQSLADGTNGVGSSYSGIFESQLLNLDPPALVRYNGSEVIHVVGASGEPRGSIQPGEQVTFTVRLSNREAGTDPNNVYLQIKNPNSKYQDSQGIEHKIFARCNENPSPDSDNSGQNPRFRYFNLPQGTSPMDYRADSRTAAQLLPNGDGLTYLNLLPALGEGYNIINNVYISQIGAVGGNDNNDTIAVGHVIGSGADAGKYFPWGPEYECQYVNPQVANPGTNLGDYGTPYYLAGVDDQEAFSGTRNPARPTTATSATNTNPATFAEWLPLKPAATDTNGNPSPDPQGGVLYTATYTTPSNPSDFYVDVIAYDNAAFPLTTVTYPTGSVSYVGQSKNWRIYDNVGGFTTQTFNGNNDVLVVSDYALGQKFTLSTFGGRNGNANLLPTLYGAESYYTDVDESILPNSTYYTATKSAPTPPKVATPAGPGSQVFDLSATPANAAVVLVWTGFTNATSYNIYRSSDGGATFTKVGTAQGNSPTYTDSGLTNNVAYYYYVTVVAGGNEGLPSNVATATPQPYSKGPAAYQQLLGSATSSITVGFGSPNYPDVLNGLGVGSYNDQNIDDQGRVDATGANLPSKQNTVANVRSQRYSLWRVLCRGPVTSAVLAGYQPTFQSQPAVNDPVNGVTAPAADGAMGDAPQVPVASRCVIWVSPFTGDLPLVDAGSLSNPSTQDTLQSYVNNGGRLFVSGQDVANALSLGGTANDPNSFLGKGLNAKFASRAGGTQILTPGKKRISADAGFNTQLGTAFLLTDNNGGIVYSAPSDNPMILGNDIENAAAKWRADASLDQLGPSPVSFLGSSLNTTNTVLGSINTITALNNATADIGTGNAYGLLYHEDYTDAMGAGYGSRVVTSSFGMEGLSIEYYPVTIKTVKYYYPRNQRPDVLHNIVCYLRTGTFTGRITNAGQGLSGATVYLKPDPSGTLPGPRQVFSATTDFQGNYTINGVEPGSYKVISYKPGFTTAVSNTDFTVEGDNTINVGLAIAPVPPGRIKGTVVDQAKNPVGGVTLTFTSTDGQTIVTGTTAPDGTYSIDNVPATSYNGTASKVPQYQTTTAPVQGNPVVVSSGGTSQADFVLIGNPATVKGTVFNDLNGNGSLDPGEPGVDGATVTFIPANTGQTTPPSVKTANGGLYSDTNLPPGTYTVSVTAPGFLTSASHQVTVTAGQVVPNENIPLTVAPPVINGYLGGLVADSFSGQPLGGATVTITGGTLTQPVTVQTTGNTSSPGGPQGDGQPLNYGPVALPPGSYTVTVTLSGYTTQTSSNQTVVSNVFTRVDFTSQSGSPLQPIHVFPGNQFSFFSVPYDYSSGGVGSVDQIFGPLNTGTFKPLNLNPSNANRSHLFAWSPVLLQYLLDPTPPADGLHLGQGYWVYLLNAREVTVAGTAPTTPTIPVGLHRGWNMIGVPSTSAVSVSRLTFANPAGGGGIAFSDASSGTYHLVSPTLYGFNGTSYTTVTSTSALQPWQAYWIYAFTDVTVQVPTGGG